MTVQSEMANGASAAGATTPPNSATPVNKDLNKNTFLQLLVAQLKNQDPMNPADGIQFVTQLAQFSQLEQTMQIQEQVAGIREILAGPGGSTKPAPAA